MYLTIMTKLTWKQTDDLASITNVSINGRLRGLCQRDEMCHNWLYTVLTTWAISDRAIDACVPVPDQFHEYLGIKHIHLVRVDDNDYHIMI